MSRQGKFLIYCVELYRSAKKISGRELSSLFTRYGVWNYIYDSYEALHTTGAKYIINDIDLFIEARASSEA
ncbi:MAG: DUF3791 domain-containing protein [Synergistes sp.]|nr:DUF3791 domain-containing protein [Synergistes sp.]